MSEKDFIKLCKELVIGYLNANLEKTDDTKISEDDIYVVWMCKTLQNNKAMVSTTLPDGMYYEITRDGDKKETYLDAYKKWKNVVIGDDLTTKKEEN